MSSLESLFKAFLATRSENADAILGDCPHRKNDYFLANRSVVLELKTLQVDRLELLPRSAQKQFQEKYLEGELWKRPLEDLPFNFAQLEKLGRPLKEDLRDANQQVRETKLGIGLPAASGVLVLLNETIERTVPQIIGWAIRRELSKDPLGDPPPYESIALVWVISEAFSGGVIRAFTAFLRHTRVADPGDAEAARRQLNAEWQVFRGYDRFDAITSDA